MTDVQTKTMDEANIYDETPYESYPYHKTSIDNIYTIGRIFGLDSPKLENARVLELGCMSGANIIPHAIHYPKAKFVGIDLSGTGADIANAHIKELGLKNIEIKSASVTDIDKSYGEFDYIICHGVISWVPEKIRHRIFDFCNKLLSKNGMAYISYNTLPGWNMVRSIREMMLYHSKNFNGVGDKIQQGQLLLNFITENSQAKDNPYAEILSAEAKLLAAQPVDYLLRDHLGANNHQYYFHEFMTEAGKNGLQYVGDLDLATMYLGNMPEKIVEKLKEVQDIVRSEQYMDFITNRRFRSTILCRNTAKLKRDISGDNIKALYFSVIIAPEKSLNDIKLEDNTELSFFCNNSRENKISTSSPILKSMLYYFAENINYPISMDELLKSILENLPKNKYKAEDVKAEVERNLLMLIFKGLLNLGPDKPAFVNKVSDKPQVSALVRAQLNWNKGAWVTNEIHTRLIINSFDNYVLRYLDGKNTKEQILDKLVSHVKSGDLDLSAGDKKISEEAEMKHAIGICLEASLNNYASAGLLVN